MPLLPPARVLPLLVALVALAACDHELEEAPPKPEAEGEIAMVSFEAVAYFDGPASNARIIERIRREKESIVFALRRQQIAVNARKQVDVELKRVIREQVTVVQKESDARRQALRVRYWFVGYGSVPPEMLKLTDVPFGLLHTDEEARAPALAACLIDDASGKPMWQRFAPEREACKRAIDDEQKAIDAAREALDAKENELVPSELDRLTLPVSLHVTSRTGRAKQEVDAGAPELAVAPRKKDPDGIDPPAAGADGPGAGSFLQKLRERAQAEAEADDEDEGAKPRKVRPPSFVVPAGRGGEGTDTGGGFIFNEPNFALLWLVGLVILGIAGNEYRRHKKKQQRSYQSSLRKRRR